MEVSGLSSGTGVLVRRVSARKSAAASNTLVFSYQATVVRDEPRPMRAWKAAEARSFLTPSRKSPFSSGTSPVKSPSPFSRLRTPVSESFWPSFGSQAALSCTSLNAGSCASTNRSATRS